MTTTSKQTEKLQLLKGINIYLVSLSNQLFYPLYSLPGLISNWWNHKQLNMNPAVHLLFSHFLSHSYFPHIPLIRYSFISPERGFCSDSLFQTLRAWTYWTQRDPIPTFKLSLMHPSIPYICVCTSAESCLHCRITHSLAQMKRGKRRNKSNPGKSSIWSLEEIERGKMH